MPHNHQLLGFLQNLTITPDTKTQVFKALDDLTSMSFEANRGQAFRQAVLDNKLALTGDAATYQGQIPTDDGFLAQAGDAAQGNVADNNFRALQSIAAQRRVLLALTEAPVGDLADIGVGDGEANIRAAITAKPNLFGRLGNAYLWGGRQDDHPVEPLLSEDQLTEIKTEATRLALEKIGAEVVRQYGMIVAKVQETNDYVPRLTQLIGTPLDSAIESLTISVKAMNKAFQDGTALLRTHHAFLEVEANHERRVELQTLLHDQEEPRTHAKQGLANALRAKIETFSTAIVDVQVANHDTNALKPLIEKATTEFESIKKAYALLVLSIEPNAVQQGNQDQKADAERALMVIKQAYFAKMIEEKNQQLTVKIAETTDDTIQDESVRRQKLGEAEALLRAIQQAATDAEALKTTMTRNLYVGHDEVLRAVDDQIAAAKVIAREASELLEPIRILYSPPRESLDYGNFFMQRAEGRLQFEFTDKLVKAGTMVDVTGTRDPQIGGGITISTSNREEVRFERVKLEPGDKIESTAKFTNPSREGRQATTVTGKLVQDHQGVVSNVTTDQLTPEQKAKMALKQAEMLLSNYTPGSGKIVIRGSGQNAAEANMVYAILLMLKDNPDRPELRDVEIESFVPGCKGPVVGGLMSKFRSEESAKAHATEDFIAASLRYEDTGKEFIATTLIDEAKVRIGQFSAAKEIRRTHTEEMKEQLKAARETPQHRKTIADQMKDSALKEGDTIDLEGHVTRRPR